MIRRTTSTILALTALALTTAANAQTMRASCDNRSGSTFADVVDSSDPSQNGYNVDPSEIYRAFNASSFPVNQNSGGNLSSANLTINSRFLGANPSTRITGFISEASGNANVTRVNTNVQARSQNQFNVCMDLTGASTAAPSLWRFVASVTTSGGSTGAARLINTSGGNIFTVTGGSLNRVVRLTTNGQYQVRSEFDTIMTSLTTGGSALSRSAQTRASLVCIADFNASGTITVQDIFDFLAAWFANDLAADSNASGGITVPDIFDFLNVWFTGCV